MNTACQSALVSRLRLQADRQAVCHERALKTLYLS